MKLKDFMRRTADVSDDHVMYMECYSREQQHRTARYPIHNYGINSCGQLVLEADYSMVEEPMTLKDFRANLHYLSPELNMFVCNDWQRRCYDEKLKELGTFGDGKNACLGLVISEDAWERWVYKRNEAVKKYHL